MKECSIKYDPSTLLLNQIEAIFRNVGLPNPNFVRESKVLHQDAKLETTDHNVQRFLINRVLRIQLGMLSENTIVQRSCLIDQGSFEDWLRLLEFEVAPCLVRNLIPTRIN